MRDYAGKPVGVMVRTGAETEAILAANPFRGRNGNRMAAILLDDAPPADALKAGTGQLDEEIALGRREIYVHYRAAWAAPSCGFRPPRNGTARNMNTIAKLAEFARGVNRRVVPLR